MGSKNGIKVNGVRYAERRLDPGDQLSVAKHQYEIKYSPAELGAVGPPPANEELPNDIFGKSLLERAGLAKKPLNLPDDGPKRYDVADDSAGQIKDRNRPT
jgi:adenylate cyclase